MQKTEQRVQDRGMVSSELIKKQLRSHPTAIEPLRHMDCEIDPTQLSDISIRRE